MYLKKIEMKGFKSFADNTEIIFKPGINVVVGPNGCGKSNLVDAVRWVLGESNIRELRGQKSEDVIFNGTDKFRPLSMANVEIVLDNEDNILPLEYSEISIGRKIFRSGESEFYLNKSRVRMKDITRLFTGTGLGKSGYSIIGQGEVEEVLNGQPIDRRLLLEEASGVIKYRQQRNETKSRLAATSNDLIRLGDILAELKQQKDELEKKAEKAEIYLKLTDEFNSLKYKVTLFEINRLKQELLKQEKSWQEKKAALKSLISAVEDEELKLKKEEEMLAFKQEYINNLKEEKYVLETELNRLKSTINLSSEKIQNKEERIKTAGLDKVKYEEMLAGIRTEIEKLEQDYSRAKEGYEERKARYVELENMLKEIKEDIEQKNHEFEIKKEQVFKTAEEAARAKNKFRESEERLKKLKEKRERLVIRKEELEERIVKQREELGFLQQKKENDDKLIPELKAEIDELVKKREVLLREINDIRQNIEVLNRKQNEIRHKMIYLNDIKKNLSGYSAAVRFVMNNSSRLPGILGILGELLEVPLGLETAIDAAAAKGLENIVVDKAANATRAIDLLKKNNAGRVTFLPLDMLKVQKVPDELINRLAKTEGVLGLASRLVKYDPVYEKAVEYLLGRTLVVNNVRIGIELFSALSYPLRIVSLEGEIINASGAMTGGSKKEQAKTPLQYRSEEKKLEEEIKKLEAELKQENEVLAGVKQKLKEIDDIIEDKKRLFTEANFTSEMLLKRVVETGERLAALEKEKQSIGQEEGAALKEINLLEQEIKELYQQQKEKDDFSEEMERELEALKTILEDKKRDLTVYEERLSAYLEQMDMRAKELESFRHNINQFKEVESSYLNAIYEADKLVTKLEKEIKSEEEIFEKAREAMEKHKEKLEEISFSLNAEKAEEGRLKGETERIKEKIAPYKSRIAELENGIKSLEISKARLETELAAVADKFREEFNLAVPETMSQMHTVRENSEYKKKMQILRSQIEEMGPVDIEAIQSYQEIKNRFDFLKQQYDDLKEARESLEKLLKETESLMHSQFTIFLEEANESFKKTFMEIFGGGDARLKLESGEDELNAGVDIEVKMPGKKTQALSLLSGGERSLTCIAFIFALLRLKPAPFCLLDEIDAALDESNLLRFARFIKKMAEEVQFIIITHRQAMIEAGETVYGVTMPEKGVSSVLTLNMKDIESMAG